MEDPKRQGWFRNTISGTTFEAEGEQAAIARKDRDVVELDGPPDNSDEKNPKMAGLRDRLDAMGIPWSENATEEELTGLIDTQATAWRADLEKQGVKNTASWKPETLKKKLDELAKPE